MNHLIDNSPQSNAASIHEASASRLSYVSSHALIRFISTQSAATLTLRIENQQTGENVETTVPAAAVRLFAQALSQMSAGDSVTLAQMGAELSTQQAAELLGVSRPYFIKLLEQGKMPFRKVGNQRRVRYFDVIQYKNDYCLAANAALDEMTEEAQRLGLYD